MGHAKLIALGEPVDLNAGCHRLDDVSKLVLSVSKVNQATHQDD